MAQIDKQGAQVTVHKQEAQGTLVASRESMCLDISTQVPPFSVNPDGDSEGALVCSAEDVEISSSASLRKVVNNSRGLFLRFHQYGWTWWWGFKFLRRRLCLRFFLFPIRSLKRGKHLTG